MLFLYRLCLQVNYLILVIYNLKCEIISLRHAVVRIMDHFCGTIFQLDFKCDVLNGLKQSGEFLDCHINRIDGN